MNECGRFFGTSTEITVSYRNMNIEHRMREEGKKKESERERQRKKERARENQYEPHSTLLTHTVLPCAHTHICIKFPAVLTHFSVCHLEIEK